MLPLRGQAAIPCFDCPPVRHRARFMTACINHWLNRKDHAGLELKAGMIFTIEPMINAGGHETRTMSDRWTVKTRDRSLSAQWEHTVLVTPSGYEVLTVSTGSPQPPALFHSV